MFIRVYISVNDTEDAIKIYKKITELLQICVNKNTITKVSRYWKVEGVYVVEARIKLNDKFNDSVWKEFLEGISDKWKFYGEPVYEALASATMKGCHYILQNVNLINVFLDE